MDKLHELALRSQTIIGGIHFFVFVFSWPSIIIFLKDYLNKDKGNFNCEPKQSDYARQRCYDHYVSTLSPLLTPLDFAGITYGALWFLWLVFILTGASIVRRIGRERNVLRKKRQSRRFMLIFVCHVCFQLAVLGVMMVLFFSFQTLEFPATYWCAQENTTLIAANQASSSQRIKCSDLRYKEKTKLNISIIVIMAISVAFCMLTLIHLGLTRKPLLEQLLGYIFIQDNNEAIRLEEVDQYSTALKASIKRETELQSKQLDIPTVAFMKTDEIFSNLLMQYGRKPIEDGDSNRRAHLKRYGQVSGTRVERCQELFTRTTDENETTKPILVTGKAGIGKTLFCQKLFRDWATDKLFLSPTNAQMPNFKFAYLLTFRQLNLLKGETLTLQELLNCSVILDEQSNISDEVFEYIRNHPEEVLIILDGFDEFSEQAKIAGDEHERYSNSYRQKMPVAALCAKLMRGKLLRKASVMITSRPDESDKIADRMDFQRKVEITGFSQQEVREYIENYFRHDEIMKNTVLEHITKNENLISFATIPVLCALMCSYMEYVLQESKSTEDLPIKASDLYFEVFNIFREKHDKNEVSHFDETFLDKLSEFAGKLLLKNTFQFSEEKLKEKFNSEEVGSLRKSGIIHCGPTFRATFSQTTKDFCFTHLTLQEYLAAHWFVKRREIPPEQTVSTMVMQFMAGILSKEKDSELMKKLLEQLSPNTCGSIVNQHLLPGKCLYEYQDKEFAKDYYRQYPFRSRRILFNNITDVDCIAISFFIDILSALNKEEANTRQQTSPSGQLPFIRVKRLEIENSEMKLSEQSSISTIKELAIVASKLSSGITRISASLVKDSCPITELILPVCKLSINRECADCIRRLLCKTLSVLNLRTNFITDDDVVSLCEVLKEPSCKLTELYLGMNLISDAGVVSLCEALKEPSCNVTKLGLNGNQITDAGAASLCEALKQPSCDVTYLLLDSNKITDIGAARLCEALEAPSCKVAALGLGGNSITDVGVVSLCEALKQPSCKVTALDLGSNCITDVGAVCLCEALKEPSCKVTALSLDSNQITDAGVVSLCEALKEPSCKVTELSLDRNQITDVGAASLCEALKQPSCKVTKLRLDRNQITDIGAASLREALKQL